VVHFAAEQVVHFVAESVVHFHPEWVVHFHRNTQSGKLYEDLKQVNNNENGHYGFYQWEGKPSFELYLNEASLGLKKAYKTQYEIKSLPVNGSSGKLKGAEQFFYVKE